MKSFVIYQLKNYIRSLIFIPPVVLYICWVGILYAYSTLDVLNSYANSAVVLYVILTWISMNIFRLEEETEKHILLVHLRQKEYFLYGKWITCIVMMIPLVLTAHFYPILTNSFQAELISSDHILSIYSHVGLGVLGVITGSFFGGTNITRTRYVWLLSALTVTASFAHSQIVELLPNGFSWLLWVLPPLRFFYEPLQTSGGGLPSGFLAAFSMAMFYILIASVIVLKMFMRKEKV
ncbi:hypothetical protein [Bacillus massiliigorillae]|uniref:hypothetical protein n=1 Tax=Bacillus massiliigorillae TaxID=1243664 RepID=UPI0003A9C207|nr:hypothetical protein [Bacillus massiliigorillae]